MPVDQTIIAAKYAEAITKAKARAAEYGASVYVCAELAVRNGLPCVTGFIVTDHHDGSAVCRMHVSRSGAATITEI